MVSLLYVLAAGFVLWSTLSAADRMVRRRMLSHLRRARCPKCCAPVGASSLREAGRIDEVFGGSCTPLPYGSSIFVDLHCDVCTQVSTITLNGDDVSVMFEDEQDGDWFNV